MDSYFVVSRPVSLPRRPLSRLTLLLLSLARPAPTSSQHPYKLRQSPTVITNLPRRRISPFHPSSSLVAPLISHLLPGSLLAPILHSLRPRFLPVFFLHTLHTSHAPTQAHDGPSLCTFTLLFLFSFQFALFFTTLRDSSRPADRALPLSMFLSSFLGTWLFGGDSSRRKMKAERPRW